MWTYIIMTFFAELPSELKKSNHRNEEAPPNRIFHFLDINHPKDEYNLVKHEIPEVIFDVVLLWGSKVSKHTYLDWMTEQYKQAVHQVRQWLKLIIENKVYCECNFF